MLGETVGLDLKVLYQSQDSVTITATASKLKPTALIQREAGAHVEAVLYMVTQQSI